MADGGAGGMGAVARYSIVNAQTALAADDAAAALRWSQCPPDFSPLMTAEPSVTQSSTGGWVKELRDGAVTYSVHGELTWGTVPTVP